MDSLSAEQASFDNPRRYGSPPYTLLVVHGGPGAGGEMAPVARVLARRWGVLEPIQTAVSLHGQVDELRQVIESFTRPPIVLIGYSWGAWLAWICAARHPELVRKLILVSSGPFEEKYVSQLQQTRQSRLTLQENDEFHNAIAALGAPHQPAKDTWLARLGQLAGKPDNFHVDPDEPFDDEHIGLNGDVYHTVWGSAAQMRASGELVGLASQIRCPVAAIHGAYDPHPAKGVSEPLSLRLKQFQFILIEACGHTPWKELDARDQFYTVLCKMCDNASVTSA